MTPTEDTSFPLARRPFGRTGLTVSEIGFGAWAIGGDSYGQVDAASAREALARAEALGCSFVDTAAVYGDSEAIIGRFLRGRRERWVLASKYSGQREGLRATLQAQLERLGTDRIDFYQIHWMPRGQDAGLLEQLARLKEEGLVRAVGVSLYSAADIEDALRVGVDGFQVCFGLLDPLPFLESLLLIRAHRPGVIVRSVLKGGFLGERYNARTRFTDPNDQRSQWVPTEVARLASQADRMRFLSTGRPSLATAAVRYPLAFPEVSTVIVSLKSAAQAEALLLATPADSLREDELARITTVQHELGLLRAGWRQHAARFVRRLRRRLGV